ncbi:acyltransferase family protein [Sphingomicrobium arenosum]|uniref:acyltransferase family protein n=1 Tax=Sphingomicrobium arenosum TaxID=2233861 RepID=UPI0022406412|nr:acyltransferase [Sphingomicrobium arenosum]
MTVTRPAAPRHAWLDLARFACAMAVVMYHYFTHAIDRNTAGVGVEHIPVLSRISDYGYLGVDFFFVISGFVIFASAMHRTPGGFAASRIVRLWPAFIACMSLTALTAMMLSHAPVTPARWLANISFFPEAFGEAPMDLVYWTLEIEIFFYILIFATIMLGWIERPHRLVLAGLVITGMAAVARISLPIFGTHGAYFVAGMALSLLYRNPNDRLAAGGFALASAAALFDLYHRAGIQQRDDMLHDQWGAVAVVAAGLALFVAMRSADIRGSATTQRLGALTYPLYLLHAQIGYMIFKTWQTPDNRFWMTPLVIAAMIALAYAVNRLVEQRPQALWKALAARWIAQPLDRAGGRAVPAYPAGA